MPLSEDEERILQQIERRFYASDPDSARRIQSTTLPRFLARNCRWALAGLVGGLIILLVSFASNWVLGIVGFALMLVSAVVLTRNLHRMGRHGLEQLNKAMKGRGVNDVLGENVRRWRRRGPDQT